MYGNTVLSLIFSKSNSFKIDFLFDTLTLETLISLVPSSSSCSGQLFPDSILSFFSAITGDIPPLNVCGRCLL